MRRQVTVDVEPQRLCVKLGWYGRFLEGELTRRIKSKDSTWCLTGLDDEKQFEVLHVMMVGLRERGREGERDALTTCLLMCSVTPCCPSAYPT